MKNLRTHVTQGRTVCVISDRHESIRSAFNNPDNGWNGSGSTHMFCIWHITQNFMRTIKDGALKDILENMGKNIKHKAYARVGCGDIFTKYCMDVIKEDLHKSNTHQVE